MATVWIKNATHPVQTLCIIINKSTLLKHPMFSNLFFFPPLNRNLKGNRFIVINEFKPKFTAAFNDIKKYGSKNKVTVLRCIGANGDHFEEDYSVLKNNTIFLVSFASPSYGY